MRSLNRIKNRQSGLALITVLLIFAVASMLAIGMQSRQKMDIAQASATFSVGQAQLLALSAEDFAKAGLTADAKFDESQNELMDNVSEMWNSNMFQGVPLGPALVTISIRDLQGLFNLNSMASTAPDPALATQRFERLLAELQLDTGIANRVRDFMNPESQASYTYQSFEPAYSASGLPFSHPSELMLIDGMDAKAYEALEPYVTALPPTVPLNVNTAPAEVLQAWDAKMDLAAAQKALEKAKSAGCEVTSRANTGFKKVEEFWDQQEIQSLAVPKGGTNSENDPNGDEDSSTNKGWNQADFDVKTNYFSVMIYTQLDDRKVILESVIKRDTTPETGFIGVIYRDFARKEHDINRLKIKPC